MQSATGQPSRENQTGRSPPNPGRFRATPTTGVTNQYQRRDCSRARVHSSNGSESAIGVEGLAKRFGDLAADPWGSGRWP